MELREGYKQTEVGVIPEDWKVLTIGESMRLINGCAFKPSDWTDQGLPIIRIQNLNDSTAKFNYFSGSVEDRHRINAGDLLFAWSGTKGTSFGARIWGGLTGVLNQHIFKVLPDEKRLTVHYAYLVFLRVQENIEKQAHGFKASFVHVKKSDLVNIKLPLPPTKTEQTAIANALSDADALIQSLTRLIAKKRQIKQGAMQTLLNPYENGRLKAGWVVKKLGDIATFNKGKGLPKSQLTPSGKLECIHYGELFTKYKEHICHVLSRTDFDEATYISKSNDILMPTSDVTPNGLATASCITKNGVILGGDILVIRPNENTLDGVFFSYLINIEREQVMQLVSGSTVYHLYGSDMAKFEFSMPEDTGEQVHIATILSDMDAGITVLETKLAKTQQIKQGMMQNLLTGRIRLL